MNHEQFQLELADYVAGRLSASERQVLEAHLANCEECSDFVSDLRGLPELLATYGDALFDEHPDPADFRRLIHGATGAEADNLKRHLSVCAPCELQFRALQEPTAGRAEMVEILHPRSSHPSHPLLKAAGIMAAGVIIGVMMGLQLGRQATTWEGPIDLPVLQPVTRSDGGPTRIVVKSGQRAVVIAIPVDALKAVADDQMMLVEVGTTTGKVIYGLNESAGRVRRAAATSGILPLLLESRSFPAGSYTVTIRRSGEAGESIALLHFEIVADIGN